MYDALETRDGSARFSSERFIFSPDTEWGQQRVSKLVVSLLVFPGQAVVLREVQRLEVSKLVCVFWTN